MCTGAWAHHVCFAMLLKEPFLLAHSSGAQHTRVLEPEAEARATRICSREPWKVNSVLCTRDGATHREDGPAPR